jgi:hypothetical protein
MHIIGTMTNSWQRARTTNSTDASFPTRNAILFNDFVTAIGVGGAAAQTTRGLFCLGGGFAGEPGSAVKPASSRIIVRPYGRGSDNDTMKIRVYGWNDLCEGDRTAAQFEETLLCEVLCTLSAKTGVSGGIVGTSDRYADTLVASYANAGVGIDVVSPANDLAGHFTLDMKGAQFVEFTFDRNSSATQCNALWRKW